MPPATRVTRMPVALYPAAAPARKSRSRLRRPIGQSPGTQGLDFAARLRAQYRDVRGHVKRRDTLLDLLHAVNATHDPVKIAEALLDRAAMWIPARSWAVVASGQSGRPALLAE